MQGLPGCRKLELSDWEQQLVIDSFSNQDNYKTTNLLLPPPSLSKILGKVNC